MKYSFSSCHITYNSINAITKNMITEKNIYIMRNFQRKHKEIFCPLSKLIGQLVIYILWRHFFFFLMFSLLTTNLSSGLLIISFHIGGKPLSKELCSKCLFLSNRLCFWLEMPYFLISKVVSTLEKTLEFLLHFLLSGDKNKSTFTFN